MAFTTTMLAWSVIEFGSSMDNQLENAKAAIRWGTDYLLKAATATPDTLYVQVGDPNQDHRCWERPEDMDTPRNVYKVSSQNPGSDVAAEMAAALAAASIVFKNSDPPYSTKLLHTAMEIMMTIPSVGMTNDLEQKFSSAFLLITYAKYLNSGGGVAACGSSSMTADKMIEVARKQVDYILGENPARMSYMVGFGERYPEHVHHRGSSVPSVHAHPGRIRCNEGFLYLYSASPNPNVLTGGIVGGPDSRDNFRDDRNNYQQSEPATYINAPFVGALAFLSSPSS